MTTPTPDSVNNDESSINNEESACIKTHTGYVMHRGGGLSEKRSAMYLETNHQSRYEQGDLQSFIYIRVGSLPRVYSDLEENGAELTLDQARTFAKKILDSVSLAEDDRREWMEIKAKSK